ncbi:MAG: hypothetical protein QOH49_4046 [Acidobacteriota bacterium]|nr:hypothetical protein [Acidobacteriota bacterium]
MIVLRGVAVCLAVGACVLLLTGWGAYRYRQSEGALLVLRVGALVALVAAVYLSLVRPLARRIGDARLARFIEERAGGTEDRLVTAVEFEEGEEARRISRALLERLRSDADGAAASVDLDRVFSRRALAAYGAAALASLLLFAGVLKWGPRGVSEGVAQLVAPSGLAAETNARAIKVKPGTARVPKGSDQEIKAALAGFESEAVSLFTRAAGASDDAWQGQAMEEAKERGEFQFSLLNMQESAEYFVESDGVRSEVFKLEVVDLPFVKQLDLVLNFPAFSRMAAKTIEDGGDVAALKGTVVTVTARLSGKARAARIVTASGRKAEMKAAGSDFVGALTVTGDTSYFIELTSVDGEVYRGSNEYDVTALEDQPPTVSFERPGRDTKATNLEEVFTQARAEDDFGVASIELFFSINGGDEQRVNLQDLSRDAARSLTGTHTFFMEEFKLKPGDFISYYAKARDAASETTSDIYFIEVKPFEMQYKQSQQQGGAGQGEGGDQDQNALTRRQKELIAATHRLMREGQRYTPQERSDGYEAVAAGQEKLKADTLEFVERLKRRMGEQLEGREELSRMAEDLRAGAREMEGAPPPLRKQAGRDALPPEQRALQRLLSADAVFREMQVATGQQQGSGSSSERESRELTDLMELELDKMKNQYETLNREQRQRAKQAKSEAERRLEELARRQERALEEQRRQQGQPRNSSGGGGGGSEREQQEMVEEARKAARELERLSRERRDARMQELSRQLEQAADDLQRAQSSSKSNPNESIAQGERALERMQQAQRRMQQMRGGGASGQQGREQEISELRRRASEAAARQRELTRESESLARRGAQQGQQQGQQQGDASTRAARERLAEREEALANSVNNLEEDARQTARALGEGKQQGAARRLNEAADALRRNRVAERMREGARGSEQARPESAREAGRAAERGLGEMSERLQEAEAAAGRPSAGGAEEALDRTRQLADDLDSLRRRLDERAARREGRGQQSQRGQQQSQSGGQQSGQQQSQSGQQSQQGQQSQGGQRGEQQGGRQQGSRSQQSGQQQGQQSAQQSGGGGGRGGDMISGSGEDDARQLGSELRERLRDAEGLRREWGGTSGGRELGGAIEQLRRIADGRMEGEALTAASLKAQVIDPLRQLELELSKRLREQLGRTNLRLSDDGAAPGRYRKSVEEYYRRLSQGGRK